MSTEVELSFRAEKDLDDILAWIACQSPQGARTWLARWKEVCRILSERPESCLLASENSDHEEEIASAHRLQDTERAEIPRHLRDSWKSCSRHKPSRTGTRPRSTGRAGCPERLAQQSTVISRLSA
jgi:plasmid stabilization system protein ParE